MVLDDALDCHHDPHLKVVASGADSLKREVTLPTAPNFRLPQLSLKNARCLTASVILLGAIFASVRSLANESCQALVLRNVSSTEAGSLRKTGQRLNDVTAYRINRRTFADEFCEHHGDCFPIHIVEAHRRVQTLKLLNCEINKSDRSIGARYVVFGTELVRTSLSPVQLRIRNLRDRLLSLGFCGRCSNELATEFIRRPQSQCSTLIGDALKGQQSAFYDLNRGGCFAHSK
jgi:hypothetical protein